jgi:hypothetical protein
MNQTQTAALDIAATPYANELGYSDVNPFEIVRQVSGRTLEIRALHTERAEWTPDVHVGGFCAHISNQLDQRWTITSDPTAPVVRIRLGARGWKDSNGNRFSLNAKPVKFYDFNF